MCEMSASALFAEQTTILDQHILQCINSRYGQVTREMAMQNSGVPMNMFKKVCGHSLGKVKVTPSKWKPLVQLNFWRGW